MAAIGSLLDLVRAVMTTRDLRARRRVIGDSNACLRLMFLHAAHEAGLTHALASPAAPDELAARLQARRPDLLDALLALGVSVGELRRDDGRYSLRGRAIRALADPENDALVAALNEVVMYHTSVYQHFASRLRGADLGRYLDDYSTVIARSSRVLEPFVAGFVRNVIPPHGPVRILEMGCGSGVYLRRAAQRNPQVTGLGVDLSGDVAFAARANLDAWGLAARFDVRVADVRALTTDAVGTFDVVTSYNNIYYIQPEDRSGLLRHLRSLLAADGELALVSMFQGTSAAACDFDVVLRSTVGCAPLPRVEDLAAQLTEAGFCAIRTTRLVPTEPLYGVRARSAATP